MSITTAPVSAHTYSNSAVDVTGRGNTLTAVGAVTYASYRKGVGARLNLGPYFTSADTADYSAGDETLSIRLGFYLHSISLVSLQGLIGKWNSSGSPREYLAYLNAGVLNWIVSSDGLNTFTNLVIGTPTVGAHNELLLWHDADLNQIGGSLNGVAATPAAHVGGVFNGSGAFRVGSYGPPAGATQHADITADYSEVVKGRFSTAEAAELYAGLLEYPYTSAVRTVKRRAETFSSVRVRR